MHFSRYSLIASFPDVGVDVGVGVGAGGVTVGVGVGVGVGVTVGASDVETVNVNFVEANALSYTACCLLSIKC